MHKPGVMQRPSIPQPLKATDVSPADWRRYRYDCPLEASLDVLGGRWKGAILYLLLTGPKRYRDLRARFPAMTPRSLAIALRDLEQGGVIGREVFPEVPPRVEYSLTARGRALEPLLLGLEEWGRAFVTLAADRDTWRSGENVAVEADSTTARSRMNVRS